MNTTSEPSPDARPVPDAASAAEHRAPDTGHLLLAALWPVAGIRVTRGVERVDGRVDPDGVEPRVRPRGAGPIGSVYRAPAARHGGGRFTTHGSPGRTGTREPGKRCPALERCDRCRDVSDGALGLMLEIACSLLWSQRMSLVVGVVRPVGGVW